LLPTSVIFCIVIFSNKRAIDLKEVDLGWVDPKTFSSKDVLLKTLFNVCITLNGDCRMQNPLFVEAEVQTLIHENSSENDVIIHTDGSVVRHVQNSWAFTA
jgi:hypothetical protein